MLHITKDQVTTVIRQPWFDSQRYQKLLSNRKQKTCSVDCESLIVGKTHLVLASGKLVLQKNHRNVSGPTYYKFIVLYFKYLKLKK